MRDTDVERAEEITETYLKGETSSRERSKRIKELLSTAATDRLL